jgi:hypothetical protein
MADKYRVSVSFPGVEQVKGLEGAFSHGISPSVFTLTVAPQNGYDGQGGALTISDGDISYVFDDCKIDRSTFEVSESGMLWQLSIFDRRWKWAFPTIQGVYNLRNDTAGEDVDVPMIVPRTEKTPQELATLLLEAMGEEDFDVGDIPNDQRNYVEWNGQPAAGYLADLCDEWLCYIVLRLNGTVKICMAGNGEELPDGGIIEDSLSIDLPARPDSIGVLGSPTRYQVDLPLEPVGQDVDGSWKPINQLSYAPTKQAPIGSSTDWSTMDFPNLSSMRQSGDSDEAWTGWQKAVATVLRCYRVIFPITVVEAGRVDTIDYVRPIYDEQVNLIQDATELDFQREPSQVYGVWSTQSFVVTDNLLRLYPASDPLPSIVINPSLSADGQGAIYFYEGGFSLDREKGIVAFGEIMYASPRLAVSKPELGSFQPALLYLRTSLSVRDCETNAWNRYQRVQQLGADFSTKTRLLLHNEIERNVFPVYQTSGGDSQSPRNEIPPSTDPAEAVPGQRANTFVISGQTDNNIRLDDQADYYISAALLEYQQPAAESRKYAGLVKIELDGAIQQMVLSLTTEAFSTYLARSTENIVHAVPYKERRMLERARQMAQLQKQRQIDADMTRDRRIAILGSIA